MQGIIQQFSEQHHIDILKIVDITTLTTEENRGYPYAILLVNALPKEYIERLNSEEKTDYSVFVSYENKTDELADKLALVIQSKGYRAISQSEKSIDIRGEYDESTRSSILPHKKIAILSGIGWIGKSNLLVTEEYGSALSMCSVLTDMPLVAQKTDILSSKCGNCNLCEKVCPVNAIHGTNWAIGISRDDVLDVYKCVACLKCLAMCRYSIIYSKN